MSLQDKFFLLTIITIFITRVFVYVFNKPSTTIKKFRIHHWMYGLLITFLRFSFSKIYTNLHLLSISIGLFLDEIGFTLIKGRSHEDNYSAKSFIILIFFMILLFIFKENIIDFYLINAN